MALESDEKRCVDLACRCLGETYGGNWKICVDLDQQHQQEKSPEVVVTNGAKTAAIEVKRLMGDSEFTNYISRLFSLEGCLAPSCGGCYRLDPPPGFHLPMDEGLMKWVQKEIERVAPSMAVGDRKAIRVPRRGHISLDSPDQSPRTVNYRDDPTSGGWLGKVLGTARIRMGNERGDWLFVGYELSGGKGRFSLVEDGDPGWEHKFITEECKDEFRRKLEDACQERAEKGRASIEWKEEWELTRLPGAGEPGVFILASTRARPVQRSVHEDVAQQTAAGQSKFYRRWADLHVVVLDRKAGLMSPERVKEAISALNGVGFEAVDLVLLADGDVIHQVRPVPD